MKIMKIILSPLGTLAARTEALMDYVAPLEELVYLPFNLSIAAL